MTIDAVQYLNSVVKIRRKTLHILSKCSDIQNDESFTNVNDQNNNDELPKHIQDMDHIKRYIEEDNDKKKDLTCEAEFINAPLAYSHLLEEHKHMNLTDEKTVISLYKSFKCNACKAIKFKSDYNCPEKKFVKIELSHYVAKKKLKSLYMIAK